MIKPLADIVATFIIDLLGGWLFLLELYTWIFTIKDSIKRKAAAIILIEKAVLIEKPPYIKLDKKIPVVHKMSKAAKPKYPNCLLYTSDAADE